MAGYQQYVTQRLILKVQIKDAINLYSADEISQGFFYFHLLYFVFNIISII